jgi:hypothetical protein
LLLKWPYYNTLKWLLLPATSGNILLSNDNEQGESMNLTKRREPRGIPANGSHDRDTIKQILDAGFLARVGFCVEGQPFVIPTFYGREGDKPYLQRSAASRMLRRLEAGVSACLTVTLVEGLVLSRPAFEHSMNHRCVAGRRSLSFIQSLAGAGAKE